MWAPHPGRGVGIEQPGSWAYSLLPYLEQGVLAKIGSGCNRDSETAPKPFNKILYETPCALWSCPSRRAAVTYPVSSETWYVTMPILSDKLDSITLSDYAANAGDVLGTWGSGPTTLKSGDLPWGTPGAYQWPEDRSPPLAHTGIDVPVHQRLSNREDGNVVNY
jgi:hypothetical protein